MMDPVIYNVDLSIYSNETKRLEGQKQGDAQTRYINARLIDRDGSIYRLNSAMIAIARIVKPDKKVSLPVAKIDTTTSRIKFELTQQALAVAGVARGEIVLFDASGQRILSSQIFEFDIDAVAGTSIESINEVGALSGLIAQAVESQAQLNKYLTSGIDATQTEHGFMSIADKIKLDGIQSGANKYSHPSSHPISIIAGLQTILDSLQSETDPILETQAKTIAAAINELKNRQDKTETNMSLLQGGRFLGIPQISSIVDFTVNLKHGEAKFFQTASDYDFAPHGKYFGFGIASKRREMHFNLVVTNGGVYYRSGGTEESYRVSGWEKL